MNIPPSQKGLFRLKKLGELKSPVYTKSLNQGRNTKGNRLRSVEAYYRLFFFKKGVRMEL